MAKLKGPLFSLGASGALGKALVFFPWKGLDVAREYVVPSNPKTAAQTTQRGYMTVVVDHIHTAMGRATLPLGEVDKMAYALWASVVKPATTWFNQAVKNYLDRILAGDDGAVYRGAGVGEFALHLDINLYSDWIMAGKITAGDFYYGTSKTSLIHKKAATITVATNKAYVDLTNLAAATKYYIQFRPTAGALYLESWSGIYYGKTD